MTAPSPETAPKSLAARVFSSSGYVLLGYGGSQFVRLVSNLILARLLFPEAFGVMALVTMVIVGLELFSDIGIGPAVAQSPRGDDPDFLNTAWTIQVIRGFVLWGIALALALPLAAFYDAPPLAGYIAVAGLGAALNGFLPTKVETGYRHLNIGRVIATDLGAQVIAIAVMVVAAWATRSVWALVIGGLVDPFLRVLLSNLFIKGPGNRLRWDKSAARDLLGFGRWITLSTAFTFLVMQGDKLVLGKVLPLDALGLYNIGYYLASFPIVVAGSLVHRVLIPVYRDAHPANSAQNARFLRRIRGLMSTGMGVSLLLLALSGPAIVGLLYDPRYAVSGTILTLVALALVPQVVGVSYDRAALAAGNSKGFFYLSGYRALVQFGLVLAGAAEFGLVGAIGGLALSGLIVHPAIVLLARRHRVWDAVHDLAAFGLGLGAAAAVFWLRWGDIQSLATTFAR